MSTRILLVDDDEVVRTVHQLMLEKIGYEVVSVDCAEDALREFTTRGSGYWSALLSDVQMPRVSGIELCIAIRSLAPRLPLFLISGWDRNQQEVKHVCNDFISKPASLEKLREMLFRHGVTS
ncbi:MAG: response regulator receiver protein [uncultured bacterium]|nr:MAG: response regulator receiver protein [uncultured bacterium]